MSRFSDIILDGLCFCVIYLTNLKSQSKYIKWQSCLENIPSPTGSFRSKGQYSVKAEVIYKGWLKWFSLSHHATACLGSYSLLSLLLCHIRYKTSVNVTFIDLYSLGNSFEEPFDKLLQYFYFHSLKKKKVYIYIYIFYI